MHAALTALRTNRLPPADDPPPHHGRSGAPAYIAFQGKVYDLSRSFLWQQGRHQVLHAAERDLSGEIEAAPHTAAMLVRVPIVGTLADGH